MASEIEGGAAGGAKALYGLALGLALAVASLGAAYVRAVPVGEAPDEPAHLAYVDYLLSHHAPPPPAAPPYGERYESFQAPLDYAATALAAAALGIHSLGLSFRPNPAFSFFKEGSRAYLPMPAGAPMERRIRALRLTHLLWAAVTAGLVLITAARLAGGRLGIALAATAPFVLSPQFLFVSATVNNDGMLTACAALATFGMVELLGATRPSPAMALLAGTAVGLAPFGKVSGFLLLAPLGLTAFVLARRRAYRPAILLAAASGFLAALWIGLTEWRFGAILPPMPTGLRRGLWAVRELLHPRWLGSLWMSFWGKLGWLNLRLPLFAYLFFAVPTILAVIGCLGTAAGPDERTHQRRQRWVLLLLCTLGANLLLVVLYLVGTDWQLQGRYFFPSLPALTGLAALGLRALSEHEPWGRHLQRGLVTLLILSAFGMAWLGIFVLARAYA